MIALFILVLLLSLLLIPIGLPGTWLMIVAGAAYSWLVPGTQLGGVAIIGCVIIALASEFADISVSARYTMKYGGSRRGAWGAVLGGLIGAVVGVPVPILGPMIGAIAGSFLGALAGELSGGAAHVGATRAATGAVIGRAVAMALKACAGLVIAIWLLAAALL